MKMKNWSTFRVEKWAYDRWSGSELLERKEFKSKKAALNYCEKINSKNTALSAPDNYEIARMLD